ncbi:MAG: transglycosylase SLT domain-containing protein [Acidobacteriia bacterium]|nr:transglycosylase SLT domain-containing protein [Terriglobia bacterium]
MTLRSWAEIFGDNSYKVVFQRQQLVLVLILAVGGGFFSALPAPTLAQSTPVQPAPSPTGSASSPPAKPRPKASSTPTSKKSTSAKSTSLKRKRKRSSPRLRRMRQAFVASASLKPMARQLLQDRTPAAYAGVEAYARRHAKEDAGALAWLVVGYARVLDHDYAKAVEPLNQAKPKAGDLGDYVSYYLASAYFQTGRIAEAIATLSDFDKTYPESLMLRDADVLYANALLSEARPQEAIALLEKDREPIRADVELALGRAYAAANQPAKAVSILRNLYFTIPLSGESGQAEIELKKLAASAPLPPASLSDRQTRADLLMKGKRFNDAASEYRDLLDEVSPSERPATQLAMVAAMRRAGQGKEAKRILESMASPTPEIAAERLFNLGEIARAADDDDGFLRILGQIRQTAPTSPWLEQALLSAGNIYLLRHDYDRAIDSYRELQERFPNGSKASYAHWKAAWLTLRQGRDADAKTAFEQQIALYPSSGEVPAALYWRARLAEEDGETAKARAYYQKLSERFRNFYYGELARQQLKKLKDDSDPVRYPLLDRVPPIASGAKVTTDEVPTDDLRVQKAELLENGALLDFATRELQATATEEKANWLPSEVARMYQDVGRYDVAIETLKKAVPNYFALDLPTLPRPYWEALFPKPYWADLKRFSASNGLDPYLVASLIRQESEFNPAAVSKANAVGLMQLLPKVGKGVARQEKLKHYTAQQLFTPTVNLQLGTRYFREMVDQFGALEYALAAYNAGADRVQDWQGLGKYRDVQEFVESIPFTETREYVQAILRNANVYRQLYGAP